MNLQEYIASGILELYALGELSGQERSEVELNLARYPEFRAELSRVEETQEKLLLQTAIQPRTALKTALFQKIDTQKPGAKTVAMRRSGFWKLAAAAAFALLAISAYVAHQYQKKLDNRFDETGRNLNVITDPAFNNIVMTGTENSPNSLAYVYWNEHTSEVYLSIKNMKALTPENQYQLWAIIDGKPVDAGVFDSDAKDLVKMKNIAGHAAAFAVTIEPRGGKESPTLSTMQVSGNVAKG